MPPMDKPVFPQALSTTFITRLKSIPNTLYLSQTNLPSRSTKRSTHTINYSELDQDYDFDDMDSGKGKGGAYDDDDDENGNDDDEDKDNDYDDDLLGDGSNRGYNFNNDAHHRNETVNLSNYQGKDAPKTNPLTQFTKQQIYFNASFQTMLIPIKLNIEYQGNKITDLFLWNINEKLITPNFFTDMYCQDLELNSQAINNEIVKQINQQIETYSSIINTPLPLNLLPANDKNELHIVLDLSINLDNQLYEDKVEWDLLNTSITPEEFAKQVIKDLCLPLEFQNAISISIHESILKFKKELLENQQLLLFLNEDLPNSNMVFKKQFGPAGSTATFPLQGLRYDLKNQGLKFQPNVEILTQWEIEKREIEKERNIRRLKRESMRVQDVGSMGAVNGAAIGSGAGSNADGAEGGDLKRARYRRRYDELEGTWKPI